MSITAHQRLSGLIDKTIAELLVRKRRALGVQAGVVRVVITGSDLTTAPLTVKSLLALQNAGYQLVIGFSHSASESGLQAALVPHINKLQGVQWFDKSPVESENTTDTSLYLPAISTNSLIKIALGIRDNMATCWVFHALRFHKPVTTTINPELTSLNESDFTPSLRSQLSEHIRTIQAFGISVSSNAQVEYGGHKKLITMKDIRQHREGEQLWINRSTLITPAAQDEIRRRNITVIR